MSANVVPFRSVELSNFTVKDVALSAIFADTSNATRVEPLAAKPDFIAKSLFIALGEKAYAGRG
jgi:hypothetical protein